VVVVGEREPGGVHRRGRRRDPRHQLVGLGRALGWRDRRHHERARPERGGLLQHGLELLLEARERNVRRARHQPRRVERGAHRRTVESVQPRELDIARARLGQRGERVLDILGKPVAQRVELHGETQPAHISG
jgi:hypothetical protein